MADKKISQLTAATTPLAGTEVLPIVQSGSTVKVSAADITAGRAISSSSLTTGAVSATSVSTGTTDIFAKVGTQLSGGNAILSRFNATNKPAGIYTGGSSGESFFGANLDWSSGNVFNYKLNGLMWYIGDPGGGGTSVSLGVASGTAGNSALVDTGGNVKFRWDTSGNYKIENGNLVVGTAAKGIDFSANTGAAGETSSLLNWYEEGTWTPVISDGTNDATMGSGNGGYYTRIGNCVTFTAQVTVGTIDSVGANAIIKGLPFSTNTSTRSRAGVAVGFGSSLNITQGRVVTAYVELNSSKIELQYWDAATGTTGLDGSEISDGGTLFVSGHYYAA